MLNTEQIRFWEGQFGSEYTLRNTFDVHSLNEEYKQLFDVSRTEMNQNFLGDYAIESVLEVGCNVGNQLRCLQHMGFKNLYGIEIQSFAVEKSKELCKGINIIQGSAFDLPFKDAYFDLVFTSGVLIHISPNDIGYILDEMYRTSKRYIWGFEYFSEKHTEVHYRENQNKMWKGNFARLFLERFPNLKLVKEKKYKYLNNDDVDQMFLLEKV